MPPVPSPAERLHWPADRIAAWQLERLRESLVRANRSPFYAARLGDAQVSSLGDLSQLPLTTKEDLRAHSPLGLVAVPPEELSQYHESYGTTGTPAASWMTRGDLLNYAAQINHAAVDFQPGERVLVRFPYAISVPAHIFTLAARERGACAIPASSRTAITPYRRVIDLLGKLQVAVVGCLPTEAIWLAETARLLGRDPARDFPQLRAICTAGELLSDARRARIAALWNARVYSMYGCTEAGNMAADCSHGRLHLSWDHFLLETLDERLEKPVPPGELGSAVVTTLTREAMPLVRFVLGDSLRIVEDHRCPCGRTAPVIEHFGRDLNRFTFDGRSYFVRDLEQRLLAAPVENIGNLWLIELRERDVCFRAEAERPDDALNRRLAKQVRDELGLPLAIETVPIGQLMDRARLLHVDPVGKPRVIGHLPPGRATGLTLDEIMTAG